MLDVRPDAVITAVSWAVLALCCYASGGGFVPCYLALRTIRMTETEGSVRLTGLDAAPMAAAGFVLWMVAPILLLWGTKSALTGAVAALVVWFGFRFRIQVTPTRTRVVRKVAFLVPWSWRIYRDPPRAFTDGWGDFADPEAVRMDLGDGKRTMELAWGDRCSGTRCEEIAAEFRRAVGRVRCSSLVGGAHD